MCCCFEGAGGIFCKYFMLRPIVEMQIALALVRHSFTFEENNLE
jgi:hypothetical protein